MTRQNNFSANTLSFIDSLKIQSVLTAHRAYVQTGVKQLIKGQ